MSEPAPMLIAEALNNLGVLAAPRIYARVIAARPASEVHQRVYALLVEVQPLLASLPGAAAAAAARLIAAWPDRDAPLPPAVVAGARDVLAAVIDDPRALPEDWDAYDPDGG